MHVRRMLIADRNRLNQFEAFAKVAGLFKKKAEGN